MTRVRIGLAMVLWSACVFAESIPITTCGRVVFRGDRGILMADLDCGLKWGTCRQCTTCFDPVQPTVPCSSSADCPDPLTQRCYSDTGFPQGSSSAAGVFVLPGARLNMNGHSIRNARNGVAGFDRNGVSGRGLVRVLGPGTISATREALSIGKGKVIGVTARDSVYGVVGGTLSLVDVTASENDIGVSANYKVYAKRLTADDNRYLGLLSYERARVKDSHLTGNVFGDISTEEEPIVSGIVCDHSALLVETAQPGIYAPDGPPFGFCSQD